MPFFWHSRCAGTSTFDSHILIVESDPLES
jgi:hypothetical protein